MHPKNHFHQYLHSLYQVWTLSDSVITPSIVHPTRDFGLATHKLDLVRGGTPVENVRTLERILSGKLPDGELPDGDPVLDFVLLNTASVLVVSDKAATFKEGVKLAREAIVSGKAREALDGFRRATRAQK